MSRLRLVAAVLTAIAVTGGGVTAVAGAASAALAWTVGGPGASPTAARLDLDDAGRLHLAVDRGGAPVLLPGRLGITTADHDFTAGLTFVGRKDRTVEEAYRMVTGKQLARRGTMRESTFTFRAVDGAQLGVVVRVADDGVAYRYVLGDSGQITVEREASTFEVPTDAKAWVQPYQTNYEKERTETTAGAANLAEPRTCTGAVCEFGYPTLFKVAENYVMLTESDVNGRYSGSRLTHADGSSSFGVELADNQPVTSNGPLSTPWRTAVVGSLDTLVSSTLVDDLAPSSEVRDTSWIRPGVADWSWLSEHSSPRDLDRQRDYIDFAAKHGLKYTLIDEGWQESWVPEVVRYARARGIDVLLWFNWNSLKTQAQRDEWLPKLKAWGVAGVKVDFMDSDAQSTFQWYDAILHDTARYKLMVNFHGATIPRGIQRTWPQVMGIEGVRGEENGQNPTRDIFLAFTRNIVGSMDYTPTWFTRPNRQNSLAHELALPVIYESGWTHLGDNPEGFDTQPVGERFLEQLPTIWDETHLVTGSPEQTAAGNHAVTIARRNGSRWFVGGILAGPAATMTAPLRFLGGGKWLAETYSDADGTLQRTVRPVTAGDEISVAAPANGGFAAMICPATAGRTSCDEPVVTAPATSLTLSPGTVSAGPGGTLPVDARFVLPSGDALRDVRMTLDRSRLPAGWTVSGSDRTTHHLVSGTPLDGHWTVTVAPDQPGGIVDVPVVVTYANPAGRGAPPIHVEQVMQVKIPLHGTVSVSDLPFRSETNGWGPVERDQSNGETAAGDGHPLTINGTTYEKGLGMNSPARIDVDVEGRCTGFVADVGVDDEVTQPGSVTFTVLGDGTQLASTGEIDSGQGPVTVNADLTGVHTLSLVVGDAGNGNGSDHADWGLARLACSTT